MLHTGDSVEAIGFVHFLFLVTAGWAVKNAIKLILDLNFVALAFIEGGGEAIFCGGVGSPLIHNTAKGVRYVIGFFFDPKILRFSFFLLVVLSS